MINILVKNNNLCKPSFKANQMPKEQALHIDKKLKEADTVDIFCHASTDEDSFNSAKTMYLYLEEMGKKPRIIVSDNPDLYGYNTQRFNIQLMKDADKNVDRADLALCVDFSKDERLNQHSLDYLKRFPEDKIVGFDHHLESGFLIKDAVRIAQSYESVKDMPKFEPANYYIDPSSKSCSAVIYRFFEALNTKLSREQLSSLFCGMCDDIKKHGVINYEKSADDLYEIKLNNSTRVDNNTKEVFDKVSSSLSSERKHKIAEHLDIMRNLMPDEKTFMKRLFDGVQFNENGKFAYFIIDPMDEDWMKFGGDTNRTSTIIRDFRIRLLKNNPNDPLISEDLREKLANIEVSGVFYPDYDEEIYKVSLHSKKDYVARYQNYVRDNLYPALQAGGHGNRGGGRITTLDEEKCRKWIDYFIKASENVQY